MVKLSVNIESKEVERLIAQLQARGGDLTPAMRAIAAALDSEKERQFETQGSPDRWAPLATATLTRRRKAGTWPGRILQVDSRLAASVQAGWDSRSARLTSNLPYAAIHQMGGRAGRRRSASIPARPYLPFTGEAYDAKLTPAATRAVAEELRSHFDVT